jgi:hypothetical protein
MINPAKFPLTEAETFLLSSPGPGTPLPGETAQYQPFTVNLKPLKSSLPGKGILSVKTFFHMDL